MSEVLAHFMKQTYCIPKPTLTEDNLPDQTGRVFIVTGGYAGVGAELAKILYSKNGIVYVAGRSPEKAGQSIKDIEEAASGSQGRLEFLQLDLSDLATIKPAVQNFLQRETRLDVLVLNAGIMFPPIGSTSAQGHELQMATNCLGHFLLARLLTPVLQRTALIVPPASVRITWAASFGVDALSPKGGVTLDECGSFKPHSTNNQTNYGATKAGNYFLAAQFAKRYPVPVDGRGIVNIAFNPGHLRTELQRHSGKIEVWLVDKLFLNPAIMGAYTELWCGWSENVRAENSGRYTWPWGRLGDVRSDVEQELGESGKAEMFWEWCERETRMFA